MRTFFLVAGPFVGLALIAIVLALFLSKLSFSLGAWARSMHRQGMLARTEVLEVYDYAAEAHDLLCDLVVELDAEKVELPDKLSERLYSLQANPPKQSKEIPYPARRRIGIR